MRYLPESDPEPRHQVYEVPYSDTSSVLEALQYIKDELDPTLSFRWSCRMAICGSCGMNINGVPRLACRTFLREYFPGPVRIDALAHFPVERDLVISAADFIAKLESIKPYIIPRVERDVSEGEYLQTPLELEKFNQFTKCINCMLCYAACPQYGIDPEFLGPGVIALAHRYNADSREPMADFVGLTPWHGSTDAVPAYPRASNENLEGADSLAPREPLTAQSAELRDEIRRLIIDELTALMKG